MAFGIDPNILTLRPGEILTDIIRRKQLALEAERIRSAERIARERIEAQKAIQAAQLAAQMRRFDIEEERLRRLAEARAGVKPIAIAEPTEKAVKFAPLEKKLPRRTLSESIKSIREATLPPPTYGYTVTKKHVVTYDKQGNIKRIPRKAGKPTTFISGEYQITIDPEGKVVERKQITEPEKFKLSQQDFYQALLSKDVPEAQARAISKFVYPERMSTSIKNYEYLLSIGVPKDEAIERAFSQDRSPAKLTEAERKRIINKKRLKNAILQVKKYGVGYLWIMKDKKRIRVPITNQTEAFTAALNLGLDPFEREIRELIESIPLREGIIRKEKSPYASMSPIDVLNKARQQARAREGEIVIVRTGIDRDTGRRVGQTSDGRIIDLATGEEVR